MLQYGKHRTRTAAARDFARQLRKKSTDAEKRVWRLLRDREFAEFKFRRQGGPVSELIPLGVKNPILGVRRQQPECRPTINGPGQQRPFPCPGIKSRHAIGGVGRSSENQVRRFRILGINNVALSGRIFT